MKSYIAILAATATALSPIAATSSLAAVTMLGTVTPRQADDNTLGQMATACAALIPGGEGTWTSKAVNIGAATYVSGPDVTSACSIDPSTVHGTGTSNLVGPYYIDGAPFRTGGSVNMFGVQYAPTKHWTNSTYDFTADYASTYSFGFQCELTQTIHHDDVAVTKDVPEGYYTNASDSSDETNQGVTHGNGGNSNGNDQINGGGGSGTNHSCTGFDYDFNKWGEDVGNCHFTPTGGTHTIILRYEAVPDTVNISTVDGGAPITQGQTDTLLAHEDWGSAVDESGKFWVGNPVVCISPKKLPGTWTTQNGYTGTLCTTAWYNNIAIVWNAAHPENSNSVTIPAI